MHISDIFDHLRGGYFDQMIDSMAGLLKAFDGVWPPGEVRLKLGYYYWECFLTLMKTFGFHQYLIKTTPDA